MDINKLIEVAVLKGQIELLTILSHKTGIESRIHGEYDGSVDAMADIFCSTSYLLQKQLDQITTTEVEKTNCEIQGYCTCTTGYCLA